MVNGAVQRATRFHGGNLPPNLRDVLKAIRAHSDLDTRGWFSHKGTVRTIVLNTVQGVSTGVADDYVRYLFNVGVLLEHSRKYLCDSERAKYVLECVSERRPVLTLDDSSASVRASQLYQDMIRRREAPPSEVLYSLDTLPPNLEKVLLALERDSGVLFAGHCGVKRARPIVGSATARNAIEPTVLFLAGVGVLLEDSLEERSVYWLDRDRITALRAFISNPEWDLPEVNPSDRLTALKKTDEPWVEPEAPAPSDEPPDAEPHPEIASPPSLLAVKSDPTLAHKWRVYLLREEFLVWVLLHGCKVVDVDLVPRIAIALRDGDFDPRLCHECGISSEALRVFVDKCVRVGIVQRLDGTNGHLTLRIMVPLEMFEVVEINERPSAPLGSHELKLMKRVRSAHATTPFTDLEAVRSCVREWMRSRRDLLCDMTEEHLTSIVLGDSAGAGGCGFVHYRPQYGDVVVSWAGFEAVDTAPQVQGTFCAPPRSSPSSCPPPAPPHVPEVQSPMEASPALAPAPVVPDAPEVPPPAQGSLEALRAELAVAREVLQSAQVRVDDLAWRVDNAERADRARREAEFAATEARLNQELQEQLAQLRARLGLE